MPCAVDTKDKGKAMQAVAASLDCGAYTSVLQRKDGAFSVYPRIKKTQKEAFVRCVSDKSISLKPEWINPPEEESK